jgi:hypothetical protein
MKAFGNVAVTARFVKARWRVSSSALSGDGDGGVKALKLADAPLEQKSGAAAFG